MSKLEKLINELCPDGVEYKNLGELGIFYGGLSGKTKEDFTEGNSKLITYMNIYSNLTLNIDVNDKVKISKHEKQNNIKFGDVLFTGSSETPDECGISSVLTTKTDELLYLNSFCFGFRFLDEKLFSPEFSKHLFRSNTLRQQIIRTANGVTRFNVSKKKMEKVVIPIPPLEVQNEIVRILDNFTELTAELTAELKARKKQYEFYREYIFNNLKSTQKHTLDFLCEVITGGDIQSDKVRKVRDEKYKYPIYGNGVDIYGYTDTYRISKDSVVISSIGANTGAIFFRDAYFTPIIRLKVVMPKNNLIDSKYLYYALSNIKINSKSGSVPNLNANDIKKIIISVPSIEEQKRIVLIFDKFDKLVNDISVGLPAEIASRQKQYEYYRDKLLTFKETIE